MLPHPVTFLAISVLATSSLVRTVNSAAIPEEVNVLEKHAGFNRHCHYVDDERMLDDGVDAVYDMQGRDDAQRERGRDRAVDLDDAVRKDEGWTSESLTPSEREGVVFAGESQMDRQIVELRCGRGKTASSSSSSSNDDEQMSGRDENCGGKDEGEGVVERERRRRRRRVRRMEDASLPLRLGGQREIASLSVVARVRVRHARDEEGRDHDGDGVGNGGGNGSLAGLGFDCTDETETRDDDPSMFVDLPRGSTHGNGVCFSAATTLRSSTRTTDNKERYENCTLSTEEYENSSKDAYFDAFPPSPSEPLDRSTQPPQQTWYDSPLIGCAAWLLILYSVGSVIGLAWLWARGWIDGTGDWIRPVGVRSERSEGVRNEGVRGRDTRGGRERGRRTEWEDQRGERVERATEWDERARAGWVSVVY